MRRDYICDKNTTCICNVCEVFSGDYLECYNLLTLTQTIYYKKYII